MPLESGVAQISTPWLCFGVMFWEYPAPQALPYTQLCTTTNGEMSPPPNEVGVIFLVYLNI
jgi:hypothetical protein